MAFARKWKTSGPRPAKIWERGAKMKPGNLAADCQEAIGIFTLHLTRAVVSTQLTTLSTLWVANTDGNFGPSSFSRCNSIPLSIYPELEKK